jgi:hypothetical protein
VDSIGVAMEQQTVERIILHDLYEAWFLHGRLLTVEESRDRERWDEETLRRTLD